MHVQTIFKALETLDSEDDDQWTSDGAPRLDVLEPLLPGVTREHLRKAAPLFNRKNRELPDLAAEREEAERAMREANDAVAAADEAKKKALAAAAVVRAHETEIRDKHTLTRQNRRWLDSQFEADKVRAAHQREYDKVVASAGGHAQIGSHPVEKNMAARNRAARRNLVVPAAPKKTG